MKKYLMVGLLVLSLLVGIEGQFLYYETGYDQEDLNFEDLSIPATGVHLVDGVNSYMEFRTFNYESIYNRYELKVTPYPNTTTPSSSVTLSISCHDGQSFTANLYNYDNWLVDGWYRTTIDMATGNTNQTITSTLERNNIVSSGHCNFTANGQDLFITAYAIGTGTGDISPGSSIAVCDRYAVPNQALADMVNRAAITVTSFWNVVDMSLMLVAFLLVIFPIIFIYKLFLYIAKRK